MLIATRVCWFKKMHPQQCWLLFEFAGSKKYTRNSVGCFSSLRVQKNVLPIVLVAPRVFGFKKMYPRRCLVATRVCGFKKMYPQ